MLIKFILELLHLNTVLVQNAFEGILPEREHKSVESSNTMLYILGHLTVSRYYFAKEIGFDDDFPFAEDFPYRGSFNEEKTYPNASKILPFFNSISKQLIVQLQHVNEAFLQAKPAHSFPTKENTNLSKLAFLCQHEAYHVGQLALLRKQVEGTTINYSSKDTL